MDSLEMAVLLYEVEREFNICIPTNVVGTLHTLEDITHFINSRSRVTEGID